MYLEPAEGLQVDRFGPRVEQLGLRHPHQLAKYDQVFLHQEMVTCKHV